MTNQNLVEATFITLANVFDRDDSTLLKFFNRVIIFTHFIGGTFGLLQWFSAGILITSVLEA